MTSYPCRWRGMMFGEACDFVSSLGDPRVVCDGSLDTWEGTYLRVWEPREFLEAMEWLTGICPSSRWFEFSQSGIIFNNCYIGGLDWILPEFHGMPFLSENLSYIGYLVRCQELTVFETWSLESSGRLWCTDMPLGQDLGIALIALKSKKIE